MKNWFKNKRKWTEPQPLGWETEKDNFAAI